MIPPTGPSGSVARSPGGRTVAAGHPQRAGLDGGAGHAPRDRQAGSGRAGAARRRGARRAPPRRRAATRRPPRLPGSGPPSRVRAPAWSRLPNRRRRRSSSSSSLRRRPRWSDGRGGGAAGPKRARGARGGVGSGWLRGSAEACGGRRGGWSHRGRPLSFIPIPVATCCSSHCSKVLFPRRTTEMPEVKLVGLGHES